MWGYAIGGESAYLSRRRLVQIATMGAVTWEMFAGLFDHLDHWLFKTVSAGNERVRQSRDLATSGSLAL
jgi:hypothetical protein